MKQSLVKIEKTYDQIAQQYADINNNELEHKPKDRILLKKFSKKVRNKKPVWEFGCGPGQIAWYLKSIGVDISGLDLSEKILQQARSLHPGMHFQKSNMLGLDFANNSIGGIVSFYAIVHFTRQQVAGAFKEMYRVLKPGGVLFIAFHIGDETIRINEFHGASIEIDFMFFQTEFIQKCLLETGFKQMEKIEREPYPEVEYQSKRAYIFAYKPYE